VPKAIALLNDRMLGFFHAEYAEFLTEFIHAKKPAQAGFVFVAAPLRMSELWLTII